MIEFKYVGKNTYIINYISNNTRKLLWRVSRVKKDNIFKLVSSKQYVNNIRSVNSSNYWHGIAIHQVNNEHRLTVYNNGYSVGLLSFDESDGTRFCPSATNRLIIQSSSDMSIASDSGTCYFAGRVDFNGATVSGLSATATAVFG